MRVADAIDAHHPGHAFWYLHIAGCDPAFQGRGIGGATIRDGLARIAGDRLPCFLETPLEKNVGFYRSLGFALVETWDVPGGGFPMEPIRAQMREMGLTPMGPPREDASRMDVLEELWADAGLEHIASKEIVVQRTFASFDEFWAINLKGASIGPLVAKIGPADAARLKEGTRARMPVGADGRVTTSGRANAIKGQVPK